MILNGQTVGGLIIRTWSLSGLFGFLITTSIIIVNTGHQTPTSHKKNKNLKLFLDTLWQQTHQVNPLLSWLTSFSLALGVRSTIAQTYCNRLRKRFFIIGTIGAHFKMSMWRRSAMKMVTLRVVFHNIVIALWHQLIKFVISIPFENTPLSISCDN